MISTAFANDLLRLILCAEPITGLADNAAVSPVGNLVLALHQADPGLEGTQETAEVVYPGYQRLLVPRLPASWNIVDNVARPAARLEFPEMTAGPNTPANWVSIGTATTGPGRILLRGKLTPGIVIGLGAMPAITTDATISFGGLTAGGLVFDDGDSLIEDGGLVLS